MDIEIPWELQTRKSQKFRIPSVTSRGRLGNFWENKTQFRTSEYMDIHSQVCMSSSCVSPTTVERIYKSLLPSYLPACCHCYSVQKNIRRIETKIGGVFQPHQCVTVCPQGEQCNIVPDNVDDIVADIAQEEKEEGLDPVSFSFSLSLSLFSIRSVVCSGRLLQYF